MYWLKSILVRRVRSRLRVDKETLAPRGLHENERPCACGQLGSVIDVAPDVGMDHLEVMVRDCLERRLFTVEAAYERIRQPDMADDPGAFMLWQLLRSR